MARAAKKTTDRPETASELDKHDAAFWLREIAAAKTRLDDWREKVKEAEERYRDEEKKEFGALNILWANVETQKAAIGEEFGVPQVRRVNQPEGDGGLSRHVATIWERTIAAAVEDTNDNHDIDLAVSDVFLPGRGQVWLELEADDAAAGAAPWVKAPLVRVPAFEYLEGQATRWGSVPWVARRHLFTLDELVSVCKMTRANADKVPRDVDMPCDDKNMSSKDKDQFKRAAVWETWTKYPEKYRIYVAENFPDRVLCCDADPYKLKNFFPCPRPMLANGDEGWQIPITDFSRYKDQADELDRVSQRIFVLTDLLRNRGAYDKKFKELGDIWQSADNVFIAVEGWAELMAKGGLVGSIQALDLSIISAVVAQLRIDRRECIELIYELSGISDLARGMTDPNETLGAQKLKKSFGAGRFRARETDARRFAAEGYTLKGEVIAEHFPREQLAEMSGVPLPLRAEIDGARQQLAQFAQIAKMQQMRQAPPPNGGPQMEGQPPQQPAPPTPPPAPPLPPEEMEKLQRLAATKFAWEDIEAVLRSDRRRCYSVKVETDQSQFVDEEADKKARTELFNVVMMTFEKVGPMIAGNPKAGEIWKQLIMFVIASFKAGRSLEEGLETAIDDAIAKAQDQAQQPQQQDPQLEADKITAQAKVEVATIGKETAAIRRETELIKQQNAGADIQAQAQKNALAAQSAQQKAQAAADDTQNKAIASQQKVIAQHDTNQAKRIGHQIDMTAKVNKAEFEARTQATAEQALLKGPTTAPGKGAKA